MDAIFGSLGLPLWIVLAIAGIIAAWLYFGKRGAQIAAAAAALLLAVLTIRKDAKRDGVQDRLEEDLENERTRQQNIDRAEDAADAVDRDIGRNPDGLRDDDGFRRD